MPEKEKASIKVTVRSNCNIGSESQPRISIEKDETLSLTSCFDYTNPFYFRVYYSSGSVDVFATAGQVRSEGSGYEDIEEIVVFSCSDTVSTSKPLSSIISTQWLGNSLGSVSTLGNGDLKVSELGYGVLKIKYRAHYKIYSLVSDVEGDVMIVATTGSSDCEEGAASATLTVEMGCASGAKQVKINVKNYLTGEAVPQATVMIFYDDSWHTFTCDQFGAVDIGMLIPGTYNIKVVKTGFVPSDEDTLNNDRFTVT